MNGQEKLTLAGGPARQARMSIKSRQTQDSTVDRKGKKRGGRKD
jgi:hypothetical protein